jgi:hypothetical protein
VAEVTSVAFAPHGQSIASGGLDRFVSQKVFRKSFLESQSPHEFFNLFFISVIGKDNLTDLCGN